MKQALFSLQRYPYSIANSRKPLQLLNKPLLPELPITSVLPDLSTALHQHPQVILQAPPGAGKTTLVPLYLMDQPWLSGQKILVLEPRRVAARACAQHMASLLKEPVGQRLGYRIRQETQVSASTQVEVLTGGVFLRMLQDDPSLEGVGLVIFDEFHERHLDSDIGLALSLQSQALFRGEDLPLKLLIMSATLDTQSLQQLLPEAPTITSEGRRFPVSIQHSKTLPLNESIVEPVVKAIAQAITPSTESSGNMLVFLPGQGEIQQCLQRLREMALTNCEVLPLYSGLSLAEQQKAIAPLADATQRKIVLATNIAETSLTIEGITLVVDAGLCREPRFDPNTGLTRLQTQRISKASATQRAGRAGRLAPGHCIRLWSAEQVLNDQITPEILQADLAPLALQLVDWGVNDPAELTWLTPPPKASYHQALDLLINLGAITENGAGQLSLTANGRRMVQFPLHPRLSNMLLQSIQHSLGTQAAWLAAILSETLRGPAQSDLALLLEWLEHKAPDLRHFGAWTAALNQQVRNFRQLLNGLPPTATAAVPHQDGAGFLLACAYPDRIAKRRSEQGNLVVYRLANGRAATLANNTSLSKCEWLAVAETGGTTTQKEDKIYSAAPLNPVLLDGPLAFLVQQRPHMEWDKKLGRFVGEQQSLIGSLIIRQKKLTELPAAVKRQALINLLKDENLRLLPWDDQSLQLQARIMLLREHDRQHPWPDFSTEHLNHSLDKWLAPHLDNVNRLDDFAKLDLTNILRQQLPWPLPKQLDELAPSHWLAPTGSSIAIDYAVTPPVLAVKLQEMFGVDRTPSVIGNRVPLCVHLLSPARRPLQITQDLAGFWRSSYQDVKKDMKGRYPKHPWPDDPLTAIAQKGVKKRPE